jgi:virginiamycin B lyase
MRLGANIEQPGLRRRRKTRKNRKLALILVVLIAAGAVISVSYFRTRTNSAAPATTYVSHVEKSAFTAEYPTQGTETSPNAITIDSSGNVWFALWNLSSIAELNPANGTIHEYHITGLKNGALVAWGIVVDNSRQVVWFPDLSSNSIWGFNMSSNKFLQYKIPTPNSFPFRLSLDKNHDVWFTELSAGKIGELTPNGTIAEYGVPQSGDTEPSGITVDSLGKIWFTLAGTDSIGYFYNGNFTIQNLTGIISTPVGIAVDSHENVWITQHGPSFISELNPEAHLIKTISTSNNSLTYSLPYFISVDSNDNIWFNEHQGNAMSEFIPSSSTLVEYFIPTRIVSEGNISYALTSALSNNGQPWYTELFTGKVGTVNITKDLGVGLKVVNYSGSSASVASGKQISLGLSVSSQSESVNLAGYVGNFTSQGNFTYSFTHNSGNGNFQSTITIHNAGAKPGVYLITITARTASLAVSKIIEITVP